MAQPSARSVRCRSVVPPGRAIRTWIGLHATADEDEVGGYAVTRSLGSTAPIKIDGISMEQKARTVIASRNPIIAVIWQAEPARIVLGPPILSARKPQNCRLTNAQPSSTESIAAPSDGREPVRVSLLQPWDDAAVLLQGQCSLIKKPTDPEHAALVTSLGSGKSSLSRAALPQFILVESRGAATSGSLDRADASVGR
jgi:hypothetical protein